MVCFAETGVSDTISGNEAGGTAPVFGSFCYTKETMVYMAVYRNGISGIVDPYGFAVWVRRLPDGVRMDAPVLDRNYCPDISSVTKSNLP